MDTDVLSSLLIALAVVTSILAFISIWTRRRANKRSQSQRRAPVAAGTAYASPEPARTVRVVTTPAASRNRPGMESSAGGALEAADKNVISQPPPTYSMNSSPPVYVEYGEAQDMVRAVPSSSEINEASVWRTTGS